MSTDLTTEYLIAHLEAIHDLKKRAMIEGIDYGVTPGTKSKPTLFKPGAEKLQMRFGLSPRFATTKTYSADGHLSVETTCFISGQFVGEADSSCSTRESKYAWRTGARLCPRCGKDSIIKGKDEYGGGWICFAKRGGCGAKFTDADTSITGQQAGRVVNPDLADSYNTVIRMAQKRAYVGAIRLACCCSSLFDEEIPGLTEGEIPNDPPAKTNGHHDHAALTRALATVTQCTTIVQLCTLRKKDEQRVCLHISGGRVSQSTELYADEAARLIASLGDNVEATVAQVHGIEEAFANVGFGNALLIRADLFARLKYPDTEKDFTWNEADWLLRDLVTNPPKPPPAEPGEVAA